jgi:hypothetical protein
VKLCIAFFAIVTACNGMEIEKTRMCTVITKDNARMLVPLDTMLNFQIVRTVLSDYSADHIQAQEFLIHVNKDIFEQLLHLVAIRKGAPHHVVTVYEQQFDTDNPQALFGAAHMLNAINALHGPEPLFRAMLLIIAKKLSALKFAADCIPLLQELSSILPRELHALINEIFLIRFQNLAKILRHKHQIKCLGGDPGRTKFSPDGHFLLDVAAAHGSSGHFTLWNITSSQATTAYHGLPGSHAMFSPNSTYLCAREHPYGGMMNYSLINLKTKVVWEFTVTSTPPPTFSDDSALLIFEDRAYLVDSHEMVPPPAIPQTSKLEVVLAKKFEQSQIRQIVLQLSLKNEELIQLELHGDYFCMLSKAAENQPQTFRIFDLASPGNVKLIYTRENVTRFTVSKDKKTLFLHRGLAASLEFIIVQFADFTSASLALDSEHNCLSCVSDGGKKILRLSEEGKLELHMYIPSLQEFSSTEIPHSFKNGREWIKHGGPVWDEDPMGHYEYFGLYWAAFAEFDEEVIVMHRKDETSAVYLEIYQLPIQLCIKKCLISELVGLIAILSDQKILTDSAIKALYEQLDPDVKALVDPSKKSS